MLETADEAPGTPKAPLGGDLTLIVCGDRGPRSVPLRRHAPIHIGRARGCELILADLSISRLHARFSRVADGVLVEDLGSRHGTWVAGARVERAALGLGAAVRLGDVVIAVARAALPGEPHAEGAPTVHEPALPVASSSASPAQESRPRELTSGNLRARLRTVEYAQVKRALELSLGNQRKAAALVGLPLRTFERRLRALRSTEATSEES